MDSLIGAGRADPNANENHSHLEFGRKKKLHLKFRSEFEM